MDQIVSDTLVLAKQGQVVSDQEPIGVTNIVGTCWKNVRTAEATIEIEDEITIIGDQSRLQHVFEDLFRNAVERGGEDVTVRVGRIGDRGIYVEDTGPGIPEASREKCLNPGILRKAVGPGLG